MGFSLGGAVLAIARDLGNERRAMAGHAIHPPYGTQRSTALDWSPHTQFTLAQRTSRGPASSAEDFADLPGLRRGERNRCLRMPRDGSRSRLVVLKTLPPGRSENCAAVQLATMVGIAFDCPPGVASRTRHVVSSSPQTTCGARCRPNTDLTLQQEERAEPVKISTWVAPTP